MDRDRVMDAAVASALPALAARKAQEAPDTKGAADAKRSPESRVPVQAPRKAKAGDAMPREPERLRAKPDVSGQRAAEPKVRPIGFPVRPGTKAEAAVTQANQNTRKGRG